MKIILKNIGALKTEVELRPAKLTVLSGGNNTGKTYAMYVLWSLFQRRTRHVFAFVERLVEQIKASGSVQIPLDDFCTQHWGTLEKGIGDGLRKRLPDLFSAPESFFDNAQIRLSLDCGAFLQFARTHPDFKRSIEVGTVSTLDVRLVPGENGLAIALTALDAAKLPASLLAELVSSLLIELVLGAQFDGSFLLPAERGGLNLFYPDLDARNSALVRHLKRDDSSPMELFRDMLVAQYAAPIDAYIQFLKKAPRISRVPGGFHDQALALQKDIVRVRYKVSKDGVITAQPYRSDAVLGIHLTSSTVKSFYGLWAWLELQAKAGDCLMIDEPELNLHPDNQRLMARLLVRLVNRGIRVVVSTHSDYLVRELNNMIMLSSDFAERDALEQRFGYDAAGAERLACADVAAYHFSDKGCAAAVVSPEFGIEVSSIDQAIDNLNQSNSDIYFALADALHAVKEPAHVQVAHDAP